MRERGRVVLLPASRRCEAFSRGFGRHLLSIFHQLFHVGYTACGPGIQGPQDTLRAHILWAGLAHAIRRHLPPGAARPSAALARPAPTWRKKQAAQPKQTQTEARRKGAATARLRSTAAQREQAHPFCSVKFHLCPFIALPGGHCDSIGISIGSATSIAPVECQQCHRAELCLQNFRGAALQAAGSGLAAERGIRAC